jgi:hypothetical protein
LGIALHKITGATGTELLIVFYGPQSDLRLMVQLSEE